MQLRRLRDHRRSATRTSPGPSELLSAIAAAGYEGTELGPPGYLGQRDELRARLEGTASRSSAAGPRSASASPSTGRKTSPSWANAGPLCRRRRDRGEGRPRATAAPRSARSPGPRRFGSVHRARLRGLAPAVRRRRAGRRRSRATAASSRRSTTHTSTYVESPCEIERVLELTDVGLLARHRPPALGGGDPIDALRDWGDAHQPHAHQRRPARRPRERGRRRRRLLEAWRRGMFCELGTGDVDLAAFFDELARSHTPAGWSSSRTWSRSRRRTPPTPRLRRCGTAPGCGSTPRFRRARASRPGRGRAAADDAAAWPHEQDLLLAREPASARRSTRRPTRAGRSGGRAGGRAGALVDLHPFRSSQHHEVSAGLPRSSITWDGTRGLSATMRRPRNTASTVREPSDASTAKRDGPSHATLLRASLAARVARVVARARRRVGLRCVTPARGPCGETAPLHRDGCTSWSRQVSTPARSRRSSAATALRLHSR